MPTLPHEGDDDHGPIPMASPESGISGRAGYCWRSLPAAVKQMLGDDTREVVDSLVMQRADELAGLGADRLLAERESDIESEIVNVGDMQPPTADATDRDVERAPKRAPVRAR
jgi:hypothetical protein